MNNSVQTFIVIIMIIIFILVIINIYYRNKALVPIISPYVILSVKEEDGYYKYFTLPSDNIPMLEKISGNLYTFNGDGIRKIKLAHYDRIINSYD